MSHTLSLYKHLTCSSLPLNQSSHPQKSQKRASPLSLSHTRTHQPYILISYQLNAMSNRRSRSIQSAGSRNITEDQITDLVFKLQQLIPETCTRRPGKVSASKVLQETCNYIRNLHREVDDLSSRLSELLSSSDVNSAQAAIIRSLLI